MLRLIFCAASLLVLSGCDADREQQARPVESADAAEGLLPIVQDGKWGYMDRSGTLSIEPRFDRAWRFSGGLALVKEGDSFGYIRPDGSYALDPRFDDAWHFSDGMAPVELDGEWGYVDSSGTMRPDTQFNLTRTALVEQAYDDDSFELIQSNGRYGYRAEDGGQVIDPRFERAWRFSEGLARVKANGKWGYIDKDGDFVIEPRFDLAWDFEGDLAMAHVGDTVGYINREGRFVWPKTQ